MGAWSALPELAKYASTAPSGRPGSLIRRLLEESAVVVLSGAGLSTASGIPDYRDRNGQWKHARPIEHAEFLRSEQMRQRYWARSFAGWPIIGRAKPNRGHDVLAQLEQRGNISTVITQNVDGLHQQAGSRAVIELHGGLARVRCLSCRQIHERSSVQEWMQSANPGRAPVVAHAAPDGDAEVAEMHQAEFRIPACPACGGVLKPDVVFFGDNVSRDRVDACTAAIDAARGLLVIGSSLMVYSGYRFAEYAHQHGKPVMAINLGKTRADAFLVEKVEEDCETFLGNFHLSDPGAGRGAKQ